MNKIQLSDFLGPFLVQLPMVAVVVAIVVLIGLVKFWLGGLSLGLGRRFRYRPQKALLTAAERSFFGVLTTSLPARHYLTFKVRLADIITPETGLSRSNWQKAFNKISAKHLDFVLCDADHLKPVLAIELDDSSHQKAARRERDVFVDAALESAGIPLLRVDVRRGYNPNELRERISQALRLPSGIRPPPMPVRG